MTGKLRFGVIGLGLIGSLHARILSEAPHAELAAVADINGATAKEIRISKAGESARALRRPACLRSKENDKENYDVQRFTDADIHSFRRG